MTQSLLWLSSRQNDHPAVQRERTREGGRESDGKRKRDREREGGSEVKQKRQGERERETERWKEGERKREN